MSASNTQKAIASRIVELGSKKNNIKKNKAVFTHFHKRVLLDFVKYIDNPHCFNNSFAKLNYCQSKIKPIQQRQRLNLVKLVTAMFTFMDVENLQIGVSDAEDMKTVSHKSIKLIYKKIWGEEIAPSTYTRVINLLKLAGYLEIEAIFIMDKQIISNPEFKGSDLNTIRSVAAYKNFTVGFMSAFSRLFDIKDVMDSRKKSIANRIASGLNNFWNMYKPFGDTYFRKKRKNEVSVMRGDEPRYPQQLT